MPKVNESDSRWTNVDWVGLGIVKLEVFHKMNALRIWLADYLEGSVDDDSFTRIERAERQGDFDVGTIQTFDTFRDEYLPDSYLVGDREDVLQEAGLIREDVLRLVDELIAAGIVTLGREVADNGADS